MVTTTHHPDDIVSDILARVEAAAKTEALTADCLKKLESEIRADWGGDRPYISRKIGDGHSERNSRIQREYLAGERLAYLERKHGISQRRILQIIKHRPARPGK